jgi:putative transposase
MSETLDPMGTAVDR